MDDKRPKCPNAGSDAGCFCTGACKAVNTPYPKTSDTDRIIAEASGGPGGGEMFRRYNEGDDVHTYRGCREGWYD